MREVAIGLARFVLDAVGFCIGGFFGFWIGAMAAISLIPGARGIGEDVPSFMGAVIGLIVGGILGAFLTARWIRSWAERAVVTSAALVFALVVILAVLGLLRGDFFEPEIIPVYVAFSLDGQRIVSTIGTSVHVFDVGSGQSVLSIAEFVAGGQCEQGCGSAAVGPDDRQLIMASVTGLHIRDALTGEYGMFIDNGCRFDYVGWPPSWDISPDGSRLVVACGWLSPVEGVVAHIFDADTGEKLSTLQGDIGPRDNAIVAFSRDGHRVLTGKGIWDAESGELLATLGTDSFPGTLYYSQDGHRAAAVEASQDQDAIIHLWDTTTSQELRQIRTDERMLVEVVLSPEGRYLYARGPEQGATVWNCESGVLLLKPGSNGDARGGRFGPEGRLLIVTDASAPHIESVWDIHTGEQLYTLPPETYRLDVSSDGGLIAVGTGDGRVVLMDFESGAQIREIELP